jgi:hypothetical protein
MHWNFRYIRGHIDLINTLCVSDVVTLDLENFYRIGWKHGILFAFIFLTLDCAYSCNIFNLIHPYLLVSILVFPQSLSALL